jgi:hypothetical protein
MNYQDSPWIRRVFQGLNTSVVDYIQDCVLRKDINALEETVRLKIREMPDITLESERTQILAKQTNYASLAQTYEYTRSVFQEGVLKLKQKIDSRQTVKTGTIDLCMDAFTKMMILDEYRKRFNQI